MKLEEFDHTLWEPWDTTPHATVWNSSQELWINFRAFSAQASHFSVLWGCWRAAWKPDGPISREGETNGSLNSLSRWIESQN